MKKILLVLPLFIALFISCSKKDEVSPSNIQGSWNLNKYKVEAKTFFGDQSMDYEVGEDLFLNLKEDGTFTGNIGLGEDFDEIVSETDTYNSTYTLSGKTLVLNLRNEFSNNTIPLTFTVASNSSNQLVLTLDKAAIQKLAEEVEKVAPDEFSVDMLDLITSLNVELTFSK